MKNNFRISQFYKKLDSIKNTNFIFFVIDFLRMLKRPKLMEIFFEVHILFTITNLTYENQHIKETTIHREL